MTYTGITCALYKGTTKRFIIDRKDYQEDILSNIENAMVFLKRMINVRYEIPYGELRRNSIPEIPYDALREAVINAVTHRDYTVKGPCTTVEVFDDRVDISSPGGLPASLKPEQFGFKSVPRNQALAEMMLRISYIEKMGTGIRKMRDLCKEAEIADPEFDFSCFFTVTFRKPVLYSTEKTTQETVQIQASSVSERGSEKILGLLRGNSYLSVREIADEIGISNRAIEKQIAALKSQGKLKRIGSAKGGHWEVVE